MLIIKLDLMKKGKVVYKNCKYEINKKDINDFNDFKNNIFSWFNSRFYLMDDIRIKEVK